MRFALVLALFAAVFAPAQQEDWCEELKKMDEDVNRIQGPLYLLRSLRQEMLRACKALDDSRLDLAELHLLRLAQVSRPYNENHANRIVAIALALRGEVRAEGSARALAVAEDLKQGRTKEAQAKIDEAINIPALATTYRAEFERLREWLKKPPDAAALEAELARWKKLRPPGFATTCATCASTGEVDCAFCLGGTVAQSCRSCSGKGENACPLCNGKGRLAHGGFAGELVLRIDKEFKYHVAGERRNRIVHPQRIFYTFRPCGGKGSFEIKTLSNPLDPNKGAGSPERHTLKCGDFYAQIQANVFTGKARVFSSAREDKKDEVTVEQAKRMFGEYEKCRDGTIPCDACEGRLKGKCGPCGGQGKRLGSCSTCDGSGASACPACRASGDSAWLAAKIPVDRVPALGGCLDAHVKALQGWQERRAKEQARREQVRTQLIEARKGLDPTAKLTPDGLNIPCGKCAGKGGTCQECWGAGRREYFPGSAPYERYALAKKLEDQFALLSRASLGVSSAEIQLHIADSAVDKEFKMPPPGKDPEPPKPPEPVDPAKAIEKADALHQDGKKALEAALGAGDDNEKRHAQAVKAKDCFREAAQLYEAAQGALEEKSLEVPRSLSEKISVNLQALKMARGMAF